MKIFDSSDTIRTLPVFFIVGSPRSGTTLLRTIFDAHPHIVIPLEYPFIIFFRKYHKKTCWSKLDLETLYDEINACEFKKYWSFSKWRVNPDALRTSLMGMEGNCTFAEIYKCVASHFLSVFPKKHISVIGDKNPAYSFIIPELLEIFPELKFIHITRDYRDQILSMQKVDFGTRLTPLAAYRWRQCQKAISRRKSNHPELFHTIKYEDLASITEKCMIEMFTFLNLEYHPSVHDFNTMRQNLEDIYKNDGILDYHRSILKPIDTSNVGKWKSEMCEKEVKMADWVVGKNAEKNGYDRKYKGSYPLLYFYLMPLYLHFTVQKFLWFFIRMLPHKTKNKILYKDSLFEKIYEKIYLRLRNLPIQEKSNTIR